MLQLKSVTKRFGATVALRDVSLQFPADQTTAMIGPSGCGKSTLLRMLVGLISADKGDVLVEETKLSRSNVKQIRHRVGYMIQEGGLFPHLTVWQNVTLMAIQLGWEAKRIEQRFQQLLALVNLASELASRYPSQLSGGQRQRVSLMRALFLDPQVVLLDEPLGALDPMIRADLQQQLREIFQQLKKTVVLVTHDISEAGYLADQIVLLQQGAVIQQGTLEDLVQRPSHSFVTEFINAQRSPLQSLGADS